MQRWATVRGSRDAPGRPGEHDDVGGLASRLPCVVGVAAPLIEDLHRDGRRKRLGQTFDGEEAVGVGRPVPAEGGDVMADDEEVAADDQGVCGRREQLRQCLVARVEVGDDDEIVRGTRRLPSEDITVHGLDGRADLLGVCGGLGERDP